MAMNACSVAAHLRETHASIPKIVPVLRYPRRIVT